MECSITANGWRYGYVCLPYRFRLQINFQRHINYTACYRAFKLYGMKCQVCKTNEAEPNSIVCGKRCNNVRLEIIKLSNKYTPTNGCDNCRGDLHQGCTEKCKEEFKKSHEFVGELYSLVRMGLNAL